MSSFGVKSSARLALLLLSCRYSKSDEAVQLMGKFKSLLDPNQILNPYKLLPEKNRYYKPHTHEHATAVTH